MFDTLHGKNMKVYYAFLINILHSLNYALLSGPHLPYSNGSLAILQKKNFGLCHNISVWKYGEVKFARTSFEIL